MSKTLICEVGNHEWEHPGGRGRPPKRCPKHREEKPRDKNPNQSENGSSTTSTPESAPASTHPNPFIERARNPFIEKARKSAERKTEVKPEPEPEPVDERGDDERLLDEAIELETIVKNATERYSHAFDAAKRFRGDLQEAQRLWDKADRTQNSLINVLARQRLINAKLEQLTAPVLAA